MMDKLPLYVPAGSNPETASEDPLLSEMRVTNKANIRLKGKKLVEYTLEVAEGSDYISEIYLVGLPTEELEGKYSKKITYVPSEGRHIDTVDNFTRYLDENDIELPKFTVILSTDLPLMTSEILDRNIEKALDIYEKSDSNIDLFYPVVREERLVKKYPEARKRIRRFKEGDFATGDLFLFDVRVLQNKKTREALEKIMTSRKTMVRLLFKFSWLAPIKYLMGRLSVHDGIFPFLNDLLDIDLALLDSEDPEICVDLDYPGEIEKFNHWLEESER